MQRYPCRVRGRRAVGLRSASRGGGGLEFLQSTVHSRAVQDKDPLVAATVNEGDLGVFLDKVMEPALVVKNQGFLVAVSAFADEEPVFPLVLESPGLTSRGVE